MFIAGTYVNYSLVSKLMLCVPIIFAMTFLLFTETPYYLLKCNKHKKAENALKFLRGCENFNETPEKVKKELLNIAKKVEEDGSSKNISIIDELSNFKDFLISNLLNLIIFYLRITCSEKSFNYRHCLGGSQSVLWGICVHKLHSRNFRRVRFKFKCKYVGYHNRNRPAAWLCGLNTNHRENDEEVSLHHNMSRNYSWIISIRGTWNALKINGYVSVQLDTNCKHVICHFHCLFGIDAIDVHNFIRNFTIKSKEISNIQLFSSFQLKFQIRSFGISFCTTLLWLIAFLLLQFFPLAVDTFQLFVCMFIFCFITVVGMLFVILCMPETKNRSAMEIERLLMKS